MAIDQILPGETETPVQGAPSSQSGNTGLMPGEIETPSSATTGAAPAPGTTGVSGFLNKVGEVGGDVATGFVKGMGDTVSGVSHLLNKIPAVGEILAPSEGVSALDTMDVSKNTAQTVGKVGEGIAEFATGDAALDGLAKAHQLVGLAQKYPSVAHVLNLATAHPWLAKIITEGLKGATVGGVQGAVKGAQQDSAASGAAIGAGVGAVAGPLGEVITNPFRAARAVASKFTGAEIQPALKTGIQDVWNTVADTAGVARPTANSIQDVGQEVGDSILARSKANYKLIDTATGGRFSGTEQALKAVQQDLRSVTNDAEEQNLLIRKNRLEMQLNKMFDDAEAQGVPKTTVAAAKSDFKQAQAIYDTTHQIRMSTTGVRPGMQGAAEVPEEVNAKSLMNRLNKLYNNGRLQQAVGDDAAEDLIGHSAIAQKAAKDVVRNKTVAKVAGAVVGVPVAGAAAGAAIEGVRKLAGE